MLGRNLGRLTRLPKSNKTGIIEIPLSLSSVYHKSLRNSITHEELAKSQRPKKLLDRVRGAIRVKHYSIRTEEAYVSWIKRYILFHDKRHPKEMGVPEIEAFLT